MKVVYPKRNVQVCGGKGGNTKGDEAEGIALNKVVVPMVSGMREMMAITRAH